METYNILQLSAADSSLLIIGQQQGNLFSSDFLQSSDTKSNYSGSFSNQIEARIADIEIKPVEDNQYLHGSALGSTSELVAPTTSSEFPTSSDYSDPLTGDVTSVSSEAVLDLATAKAKEQLESFASDAEFLEKMNLAFEENWQSQAAEALIQDLASGETIPAIEILSAANLKADGAFGENTIYLSQEFLSENAANSETVASVLLEEIGHYVDQQLNSVDSPGDEGEIFSKLVQSETISDAVIEVLKTEDDNATIAHNGQVITVELAVTSESAAAPPYPGYNLRYDPNAPEYNEDPAVVRLWQQRMLDLGYEITVDGLYGEQSKAVAITFQQAQGLADDGVRK